MFFFVSRQYFQELLLRNSNKLIIKFIIFTKKIHTSQVDHMSQIPGKIRESETNGIKETNRATFNLKLNKSH
jgi:hypothetical protein